MRNLSTSYGLRCLCFLCFVVSVLSLSEERLMAQAAVVTDPGSYAMDRLLDANRIAEFEQTFESSMNMLESMNELVKESGISNKNWEWLTKGGEYFQKAQSWKRFAQEEVNMIRTYTNSVKNLKYLTSGGYIDPAYAARLITNLSNQATRAIKTVKYVSNFYTTANSSMSATEKLKEIDRYADSIGYYRRGMNMLMTNTYQKLMERAEVDGAMAALRNAELKKADKDRLTTGINTIFTTGTATIGELTENRTPQWWANDIRTKYYTNSMINQEKEDVKAAVGQDLTRPRTILYRVVEVIIAVLALLYTAVNLLKVTKGEGQSKDALLKVFLGLLFGAAALAILEAFFGSSSIF